MPTASDSEQTTQPGRQSNSKVSNTWPKIREILNNKWVLLIISIILIITFWTPYFVTGHEWNSPNVHWLPISLMLTIIFATILFLWKKVWFLKNISQFNSWIFGVTIIGGTIAFLLPLAIADNFSNNGEGAALRQMLIYTTGGLLGVITLSETRRKNDQEKEKNKDEKKKNKQDHIRQVHAERRSRYAKAIEQLADDKAAIRIGGIYTLVGLVDEWLTDKNIKDKDDRRKEGQVIINNLCSYIRSPFTLAVKAKTLEADSEPDNYEGDFFKDQTAFHEEQDVRRVIFVEMSKRSSPLTKDENNNISKAKPGKWSHFQFDFSRAPIFYSLREIKFINANFNNAKFYGHTDFSHSQFYGETNMQHVDFYGPTRFDYTHFHNGFNLSFSHFHMKAGLTSSTVREKGIFRETHFHKEAFFSDTDFLPEGSAIFSFTKFHQRTVFNNTNFYGEAIFSADFMSSASFEGALFEVEPNFKHSQFSVKKEHNFETRESSPHHIKTKVKKYKGKPIKLPIGADIYTPNRGKNCLLTILKIPQNYKYIFN